MKRGRSCEHYGQFATITALANELPRITRVKIETYAKPRAPPRGNY